jgi:hypothetical protein
MKNKIKKSLALFFVLGFFFIPLTFNGKDWQYQFTNFIFSKPITFFQQLFFKNALQNIDFSSDTIALNLLLFSLFLISILIILVLELLKINTYKIVSIARILSCYYISLILLKYGFDKVFKAQFYLPEPNILYTPFGNLSKDILYWSTIGTSHFYSFSIGIIEVLVAFLILFTRTRVFGLLLSIGVFINIVILNFSFDISVKTFSIFLLMTSLFAVFPKLKSVANFFIFHKSEQLVIDKTPIITNYFLSIWTKIIIINSFLIIVLFPYFQTNNFNDDEHERPFLHGAYHVNTVLKNNDTLALCDFPVQKIFVHRNNYLIFQDKNNKMNDYFFETNLITKQLTLQKNNKNKIVVAYEYIKKDSIFTLKFKNFLIISKALNWKKLPAIQNQTHFTIDEIK